MTDLDALWLARLEAVMDRAAHEVKDALNGVVLNVEVARSRSAKPELQATALGPFAEAAAAQLETLGQRVEAVLFLGRPQKGGVDVGITLRHLARLLVPAARADGGSLEVEAGTVPAVTSAPAAAVRLALAAGLMAATPKGAAGRCRLDAAVPDSAAVVRFSHESAGACSLDPATVAALAGHAVRVEGSGQDLVLVFPR